jgi:hypothetical protein
MPFARTCSPRRARPGGRRGALLRLGLGWGAVWSAGALTAAAPARAGSPLGRAHAERGGSADPVVLTLRVLLKGQPEREITMSMAELAALPQHSYSTRTPWYARARKFTGPLLRELLRHHGIEGAATLRAIALNNYKAELPVEDVMRHDVVLARLLDDKPMAIRDKGPLFIIYPFDANERLQSERYYNRCAWQLRTLEVR